MYLEYIIKCCYGIDLSYITMLPSIGASFACMRWARMHSSFSAIPVIDVAPLMDAASSHREKYEVGTQLHKACTDVGFFYIKNHDVPDSISKGVLSAAREWFQLPADVKKAISISPAAHYRGYQDLGANVTRHDGGFQRDWHEAIDLYREVLQQHEQADPVSASALHGPNQWPEQHPAFNATLRRYIHEMTRVGAGVMRGIALGLGLPEAFFDSQMRGPPYWCVRVIHYPPLITGGRSGSAGARAAIEGAEVHRSTQLSCGEHTDYGLLTLVNQEEHISALQVKNASGDWITASPIPGTFVCNIGDMMRVWTNGLYTPTLHRVINPDPSQSRVSIPYFYEPAFDTVVEPVPGLHGSSPTPVVTGKHYGTHLEKKVFSNFELEN